MLRLTPLICSLIANLMAATEAEGAGPQRHNVEGQLRERLFAGIWKKRYYVLEAGDMERFTCYASKRVSVYRFASSPPPPSLSLSLCLSPGTHVAVHRVRDPGSPSSPSRTVQDRRKNNPIYSWRLEDVREVRIDTELRNSQSICRFDLVVERKVSMDPVSADVFCLLCITDLPIGCLFF